MKRSFNDAFQTAFYVGKMILRNVFQTFLKAEAVDRYGDTLLLTNDCSSFLSLKTIE